MVTPVQPSFLARCITAGFLLLLAGCVQTGTIETPTSKSLPPSPTSSPTSPSPTFTAAPLPSLSPSAAPTSTPLPTSTPTLSPTNTPEPVGPYAVVRVEPDDTLNVRSGPGISHVILTRLAYDTLSILLTTRSQSVDGRLWVEILTGPDQTGWVNDYYLTRFSSASIFCSDPRLQSLLDRFEAALVTQDGALLAQVISPRHGLDLIYLRTGNIVPFPQTTLSGLFSSTTVYNWGVHPASALEVQGTFSSEVLPKLSAVLSADYTLTCDQPGPGINNYPDAWPARYTNLNYLALFKPGTPGVDLDWLGWLVGIEYIDSQPYITVLIHFFWEP